MQPLGNDWHLTGMAHLFPHATLGAPFRGVGPLNRTTFSAAHAMIMANIESRDSRIVLRLTPNFEGITMPGGELTFGGWGEGFIDARHPHTLPHEIMLSLNLWDFAGGALSISGGRGFAAYGTDDPMSRPVMKYPTNHHLSQILERWTVNGVYLYRGWGIEGSIFGGAEPEHPYDISNIRAFGDSWSTRISRRFGEEKSMAIEAEGKIARIAQAQAAGLLDTDVLWYHADYVAPSWGKRLNRQTKVGLHIFYS
jgi:hypothetical protein